MRTWRCTDCGYVYARGRETMTASGLAHAVRDARGVLIAHHTSVEVLDDDGPYPTTGEPTMPDAPAPTPTPRTTPVPRPRPPVEIVAHTVLTGLVIVALSVAFLLGRLPLWPWLGGLALCAGWVTPAVLLQLVRAYARATWAPPPPGAPPGADGPRLPPPATMALVALLGPLGRAARHLMHLVLGAVVLAGCPRLPPPDGCVPRAYRCLEGGRPEVCSTSRRWTRIGDLPCADVGAVCVVLEGVARCQPVGSADGDGGAR